MKLDTTIEELEAQIEAALSVLNPRQRRFATTLVEGNGVSATTVVRQIDGKVNEATVHSVASQIRHTPRVAHAIKLLQHRQELRTGIEAARKRQMLLEIAGKHKDETPSAAVSAIKTLNDMDGDNAALKIQHGGQVNLAPVNYQLDTGRVLEHDPGSNPLLELITDEADCDHISDHETLCEDTEWLK